MSLLPLIVLYVKKIGLEYYKRIFLVYSVTVFKLTFSFCFFFQSFGLIEIVAVTWDCGSGDKVTSGVCRLRPDCFRKIFYQSTSSVWYVGVLLYTGQNVQGSSSSVQELGVYRVFLFFFLKETDLLYSGTVLVFR